MRCTRHNAKSFGSLAVRAPLASPGQRIGIMGGSFNPPHDGHLTVARTAVKRLGLDQVWWLVTPGNPLKHNGELPELRVRLAATRRLAAAAGPRMRVSGLEERLGSAFTVDTLAFLRRRHRGVHFVWLMGADGLATFHRWRDWRRIARLMPIVVVDRPGYRLAAMASPAARALARFHLPEVTGAGIAARPAPAWAFLSTRLSPLSSTELRAKTMLQPPGS